MIKGRKHIRLRGFDYSFPNLYFITICVKNFEHAFGEVRNGIMGLSEIGNIAALYLQEIPILRKNLLLDEFIVMPNHIHLILDLQKTDDLHYATNKFGKLVRNSISVIINQYKGAVKNGAI